MKHEHVWIAMQDGTRLAARLFLPDELPTAVILEALPYRMDDLTAWYASEYARLCEEGGFAVCRLDILGTGSSEGIALDEYHPQEQADICEAIAWLATQDWCTGRVGMYGTSWGGFNSLQVAMERPPALHAIVPIYASDDRYTDDVHYMGGVLKALDLVDWVLYMAACNVLPPVPAVYGRGWREEWLPWIEGSEPWLLRWLDEQGGARGGRTPGPSRPCTPPRRRPRAPRRPRSPLSVGSYAWLTSCTQWSASRIRSGAEPSTRRSDSRSPATWTSSATGSSRRRTTSSPSGTSKTCSS